MPTTYLDGTTWIFNENIPWQELDSTYSMRFVSNGRTFYNFKLWTDDDVEMGASFNIYYDSSTQAYWIDNNEQTGHWAQQGAYRTIEIIDGTTSTVLRDFIQANATQVLPGTTYEITHSLTNLIHGNVSFTVTPDTGYSLPSSVSVSNGTLVSYDSSTGVIVVSGDGAEISVTCEQASGFVQIYPTVEDDATKISNMDTSKIYSIKAYNDYWESNAAYGYLQYNNSWQLSGNSDFVIDRQTSSQVYFHIGSGYYFQDNKGIILEGNVAATASDFDDYTETSQFAFYYCMAEETKVTLSDMTTKNIEDLTYDDELLVWDFYEGKLGSAKPMWIKQPQIADEYNLVTLSNGTQIKFIGEGEGQGYHRVYNVDKEEFTHTGCDETPNGTIVYCEDGSKPSIVSQEIIKEKVNFYNVITDKHYNIFANGILTSCKLSNRYGIEDMKYDLDDVRMTESDIEQYLERLEKTRKD